MCFYCRKCGDLIRTCNEANKGEFRCNDVDYSEICWKCSDKKILTLKIQQFNDPILDYNRKANDCEFRTNGRSITNPCSLEEPLSEKLQECICILSDSDYYKQICTTEILNKCLGVKKKEEE